MFRITTKLTVAALLWAAIPSLKAANEAGDAATNYTNPWNAANPQNGGFGFSDWQFSTDEESAGTDYTSIQNGRWTFDVLPDDPQGNPHYDAAFRGFTGDGQIDVGQTLAVQLFFTPPGPFTVSGQTPSEGFDLFAQDPAGSPSNYLSYGHEAVGLYLGPNGFYLAYNPVVSDENYKSGGPNPFPFTGTASDPQEVTLYYTALANNGFDLKAFTNGYYYDFTGTLFNNALDGLRIFTSQGGTDPGGPLACSEMIVGNLNPVPEPSLSSFLCLGLVAHGGWIMLTKRRKVC